MLRDLAGGEKAKFSDMYSFPGQSFIEARSPEYVKLMDAFDQTKNAQQLADISQVLHKVGGAIAMSASTIGAGPTVVKALSHIASKEPVASIVRGLLIGLGVRFGFGPKSVDIEGEPDFSQALDELEDVLKRNPDATTVPEDTSIPEDVGLPEIVLPSDYIDSIEGLQETVEEQSGIIQKLRDVISRLYFSIPTRLPTYMIPGATGPQEHGGGSGRPMQGPDVPPYCGKEVIDALNQYGEDYRKYISKECAPLASWAEHRINMEDGKDVEPRRSVVPAERGIGRQPRGVQ
jgi:hypothetical protein